MTRHLHEPANALLYRALDLPPAQRQQFLSEACEGEPDLLELVKTLLARIDQLDEFLESPELSSQLPPGPVIVPHPGDTLGHWRLLREIGRDGMDVVFVAERDDGTVRQPGIFKIALVSGSCSDTLARFQRERQRLSTLKHPDIARLIDTGRTGDGRPFFVMELCEGVPLDQYCADQQLNLRQRAALFAQVCNAVHYAHQRLLIHRDLKPANIVIGPDGSPKLLEFGIASEAGRWPLTPLFASPEQLAGQPLCTSSDIYSLGAILYGLLTGRSPNAAEASGIVNVLARPAPVLPSVAVSEAAARHYPPLPELFPDALLRPDRKLARQLKGDLDDILMKAIALDPAQRYASADAFARDLQAYAQGRPRHPVRTAAAVIALCALLIGSGVVLWKARAGELARAAAVQPVAPTPAPTVKIADALDPLTRRFATASRLFTRGQSDAAQLAEALQQFSRLQRELHSFNEQHRGNVDALELHLSVLAQLAQLRRISGDLEGAQQAADQLLGLAQEQQQAKLDEPRWRGQLGAAHRLVGELSIEQGHSTRGLEELRKALALREDIAAKDAGSDASVRAVADAHAAIGNALMATMDFAAAEPELTLARDTYAAQAHAKPVDGALRTGLIELEIARANSQQLQRHGRSAVQTLAVLRGLTGAMKPAGVDPQLAARIAMLEAQIQPRGTPAKAFAAAEQALVELLKLSENDPLDIDQLRSSALAWMTTGEIGLRARQTESACRYLDLAAKRFDQLDTSKRLNAIGKLQQGQLQERRKACA
jgi:tetratricopeptide (TPR) repeat protein